jgi:M6 family metalloprotease-like protein
MKKIFVTIVMALCCISAAWAVPAYPGLIRHTQPDGSVIMIRIHGDEYCHWVTDAAGQVLEMGVDGYYRPASSSSLASRRAVGRARRAAANERRTAPGKRSVATGEKRFLVILLSFSDVDFTISNPQQAFTNLMNESGYSANGGTGSVRDYYTDNSHGVFTPVFDVVGPYQVSNTASHYAGASGVENAEEAFYEACELARNDIDFSNYDLDGDGKVDMVFFYYAGYNQAEGKANTIWPHQYTFQSTSYRTITFNGKKLGNYACTSELRGSSGTNMCGIGTACHEFGHAMGLPDFYDTDYEDNGQSAAMFFFSTMDSGSYNNDGRTPPYFTIEERIILGWLTEAQAYREFCFSGNYTIGTVDDNIAYRTQTDEDGEYFVYECRGSNGWDAGLEGHGLVVTHVDKSSRSVSILNSAGNTVTQTASSLWSKWEQYNSINENGSHPCCYVVPAADQSNLLYGHILYQGSYYFDSNYSNYIPFPGVTGTTSYTARSWNGVDSDIQLSNISYSNNQVTLFASVPSPTLNYNVIYNPGNGVYAAGSPFALSLVESTAQPVSSVSWYLDDEPVSGPSIVLTAGTHVIEAHLTLATGETKILELSVVAQ